ncbi:MAG: hypothetical protein ACHQY2_01090 [Candidatus Eremiobacterales bacterium]
MGARTTFLGKLLGIYLVLVSIAMAANKAATIQTVTALIHDAPVIFVLGLILVAAGLAMILSVGGWSRGALPLVVSLVSWLTLIKGLAFLLWPPSAAPGIVLWGSLYEQFFYVDVAIVFVLGAYLTIASFKARA